MSAPPLSPPEVEATEKLDRWVTQILQTSKKEYATDMAKVMKHIGEQSSGEVLGDAANALRLLGLEEEADTMVEPSDGQAKSEEPSDAKAQANEMGEPSDAQAKSSVGVAIANKRTSTRTKSASQYQRAKLCTSSRS